MEKNGLKVCFYSGALLTGRMFKSTGSELVIDYENKYSFIKNAIKPINSWKSLSVKELEDYILVSDDFSYQTNIGLLQLPSDLINKFDELKINEISSYKQLELIKKENSRLYNKMVYNLEFFLSEYLISNNEIDVLGFKIRPGDSETSTLENSKYVGLHIDSCSSTSKIYYKKTNRISINLGKGIRYLVFVNLTLRQMYNRIQLINKEPFQTYNKEKITRDFLKTNTEYPILKMSVMPYEAYIAPTENCVHDGSTLGNPYTDITFIVRGHFKII